MLRFAPIFGTEVNNPLSRYLRLPLVPTRIGYDPRMQLISERDAVDALRHVVANPVNGVFNVASDNCTVGQVGDKVKEQVEGLTGTKIGIEITVADSA